MGQFCWERGVFLAMTGLNENLLTERVEARLCSGGMEEGGGTELEAEEIVEITGAGRGGGAV